MNTFYWHDYETFGANPSRDRPAQFAGIRTDEDLQEIGEPLELFCRPQADYLPQPEACLITGITPQQAWQQGVTEAEFAARIVAELGRPGTCGVGYNSLRFDDEVTRYLLWRTLHDPYAREWQDGNSRWDIIDMLRCAYALRPDGIEWPMGDDGQVSFRLDRLAPANGIAHADAHDAVADVRATIALARRLRQAQPKLWDYLYGLRRKQPLRELLDLRHPKPLLHVSSKYPRETACTTVVLPLARHPHNSNGVIVFDLRKNPAELLQLDAEAIRQRVFTRREDLPEGQQRIGLKTVHLNKCPVLVPFTRLTDAQQERLQLDLGAVERHRQQLAGHNLSGKLAEVMQPPPRDAVQDVDSALYAGFVEAADRQQLEHLRGDAKAMAVPARWLDPRLPELLSRHVARNYPTQLDAAAAAAWAEHCTQRLEDDGHGWGLERYFETLQTLAEAAPDDARQQAILEALGAWGDALIADPGLLEATASRPGQAH